jgi:hypothetical protein
MDAMDILPLDRQPKLMFLPHIVSADERGQLQTIAEDYLATGVLQPNPAGPKRYRVKMYGTEHCTPFITSLAERIKTRLGLNEYEVDEHLGWVISLIQPGGFLHTHIDDFSHYDRNSVRHLRCNIMVARENDSYDPFVENMIMKIPECCMWAFFASESVHGTQLVTGSTDRIVYQFGFAVPSDYVLSDINNQGQAWYG